MIFFSATLFLAVLTHYSTLWFVLATGIYGLILMLYRRPLPRLVAAWAGSQGVAAALYAVLYVTHISKLRGGGMEQEAAGGWLQSSYFDPAKDTLWAFLFDGTVALFQYIFANRIVGFAMLFLFGAAVTLLFAKDAPGERIRFRVRPLALVLLPFLVSWCAAATRMYPYGGTRHCVFLAIFVIAGASFALAELMGRKLWPALSALGVALMIGNAYPTPPAQPLYAEQQSRALMTRTVNHIQQSIPAGKLVFVDYQTSVLLGYYLGRNQITSFSEHEREFREFPYGGYRIVSSRNWLFNVESFGIEFRRLKEVYGLAPGELVWIVSGGWGVNLYSRLTSRFPRSHFPGVMFGSNLAVFQVPTL
jgi:hypothetical protein